MTNFSSLKITIGYYFLLATEKYWFLVFFRVRHYQNNNFMSVQMRNVTNFTLIIECDTKYNSHILLIDSYNSHKLLNRQTHDIAELTWSMCIQCSSKLPFSGNVHYLNIFIETYLKSVKCESLFLHVMTADAHDCGFRKIHDHFIVFQRTERLLIQLNYNKYFAIAVFFI